MSSSIAEASEEAEGGPNNQSNTVPVVGMFFQSEEAAKTFYRQYGIRIGFATKIRNSKKGGDGNLKYFVLSCAREGTNVSTVPADINSQPTKKIQCPAKMSVGLKDGLWYVLTVNLEHCHDMSPSKSRLFSGNRKINLHVRRTIQINDDAGVRLNKTYRSLVCEAGGFENLPFVERDVRNFVGKERRDLGKEGDGKALLSYFTRMREANKDFYYEIDLDDNFRVVNVFWADARSRAACEYFGDVISFDTTYLTNKYDMPFSPFVGVNHHGQSILLGCGLVSAEDTKSFVWLFEAWLRSMSSRHPHGIVTDQCRAMQNAIEVVFPNTTHRWCLWHIMKKIPEKLSGFHQYKDIKRAMKKCVYDTLTTEDFTISWNAMIVNFDLCNNDWLSGLFVERIKWVPCFLKHQFWAGMSSTQRSESMNAFFDGYVKSTTSLQEFVTQYDNALQDKAEKETLADFQSCNTILPCGSTSAIECQYQSNYTHAKFKEVQGEFRGKINCSITNMNLYGQMCCYEVTEEKQFFQHVRDIKFDVYFVRQEEIDFRCTCLLFEFRGIICRHSLMILAHEKVKAVPCKYILNRWSKKVSRKYAHLKTSYDPKVVHPRMERFDGLCKRFYEIAEVAADNINKTKVVHDALKSVEEKLKQMEVQNQSTETPSSLKNNVNVEGTSQQPHVVVLSPKQVPRKGRPRENRRKSTVEKILHKAPVSRRNQTQVVTTNETIDIQGGSSSLHVASSVEITSVDRNNGSSFVPSNVNPNVNVYETSSACLSPQLSNVRTLGFVSLLNLFNNDGNNANT